jgi:hypothetical protein
MVTTDDRRQDRAMPPETTPFPKSYMTDAERDELRRDGATDHLIYNLESAAADEAGDDDAATAWLCFIDLPDDCLLTLKHSFGADYLRRVGYKLTAAEKAYGADWLDNPAI